MMRLWLLRPNDCLIGDNPWEPWYDKAFGFVVRAETEQRARELAHAQGGDESRGTFLGRKTAETNTPWLDEKYSSCEPLADDGDEGVVMMDFHSA